MKSGIKTNENNNSRLLEKVIVNMPRRSSRNNPKGIQSNDKPKLSPDTSYSPSGVVDVIDEFVAAAEDQEVLENNEDEIAKIPGFEKSQTQSDVSIIKEILFCPNQYSLKSGCETDKYILFFFRKILSLRSQQQWSKMML